MTSDVKHFHPFGGFERGMERVLGADLRLVYGMAMPMLMIIGLIILLALGPTTWLVVGILLLEIAALGVIVTGVFGMMSGDDEDDDLSAG